MADTKQVTGPVKPFYDDAQNAIDEQAILDKYNAATMAQFAAQREQNRQNENKFYNEMYNTQKTAMDTIRQSNAAAVSSGASRGVQAANELSALLGLEQESVASATELAQANRQTAQEETAAVLENVLKAYQDAAQQRSDLTMQGIQAASLNATDKQADAQIEANRQQEIKTYADMYAQAQADGDAAAARLAWENLQRLNGNTGSDTATTPAQSTETGTPVYNSGVQEDGSLAFSTGDLNTKNYNNIRAALKDYGYNFDFDNDVFDITNIEEYDKIKQWDLDAAHQTGEAKAYIDALRSDAASGKIPVGSLVQANYGNIENLIGDNKLLVYLGNKRFMPVSRNADNLIRLGLDYNVYVPDGYKINQNVFEGYSNKHLGTLAEYNNPNKNQNHNWRNESWRNEYKPKAPVYLVTQISKA